MARKPPPYEIRLVAFMRHADGALSILDIIETSRFYAPKFASRFYRDKDCVAIAASAPGEGWKTAEPRFITR